MRGNLHTVTWVTDINQQTNSLALGEVQPRHLAVGQTCNAQGLEELRSPPQNTATIMVGRFKKEPRTQYAAGQ
jgi:hypothetical protein